MLAMANNASATKVGCHIPQLHLRFWPLYCKKEKRRIDILFYYQKLMLQSAQLDFSTQKYKEYIVVPLL